MADQHEEDRICFETIADIEAGTQQEQESKLHQHELDQVLGKIGEIDDLEPLKFSECGDHLSVVESKLNSNPFTDGNQAEAMNGNHLETASDKPKSVYYDPPDTQSNKQLIVTLNETQIK